MDDVVHFMFRFEIDAWPRLKYSRNDAAHGEERT